MIEQELLLEACKKLGLQEDVKITEVHGFRWKLEYTQKATYPDFGKNIMKLEKMLQGTIKRPIDLRLESSSDKNKREQRNVLNERK